ncbi:MAG: methionyl-tRNA formyltransferase [Syntrophobacteraceae bacterium]|nr:methionyl-tRNA formyltransferase [Syntrophobacteraceae bacterium]
MTRDLPTLIFFGTPEFAVPSLNALLSRDAPVKLVVTQPDRPRGRGKKLAPPAVKNLALERGIPVFQPPKIRDLAAIDHIVSFGAQCAVVVAYGQLFPARLLSQFPLGTINVHASLLPHYRGAAPIQRSLLAGDRLTGVSIMLLDEGMDTGPVLSRRETVIEEGLSFGALHDRLADLGAGLLCETLDDWNAGRIRPELQDSALATHAPPVGKEELRLDWSLPARVLARRILAFDPAPGAYFLLQGRRVKCFDARVLPLEGEGRAGEVLGLSETGLVVRGGDGICLVLGSVQLEGQRRLPAAEFIRGRSIEPGTVLE